MDERYKKQAERLLYGELAAALEIPFDEVESYIARRVEVLAPLISPFALTEKAAVRTKSPDGSFYSSNV